MPVILLTLPFSFIEISPWKTPNMKIKLFDYLRTFVESLSQQIFSIFQIESTYILFAAHESARND